MQFDYSMAFVCQEIKGLLTYLLTYAHNLSMAFLLCLHNFEVSVYEYSLVEM